MDILVVQLRTSTARSNPFVLTLCEASLALWDDNQSRLGILSGRSFASDVVVSQRAYGPARASV